MSAFRNDRTRKPYSRPQRSSAPDGQWVHDKAPSGPRALQNSGRPLPAVINSKLLVSNLHYEISPKDLTAIFGQIGTLVREPLIKYDRSGRSSGVAVIAFESPTEATRAKKQFDGILAKGQPMSIAYDTAPPFAKTERRASTGSLLQRIQKAPLLERLTQDDSAVKAPSAPRGRIGPMRTKDRGGRARAAKPRASKPKTAEELDKELDAFMGDDDMALKAAPAVVEADIAMS